MDIGNRIIELRKKKQISTNKLANLAGISQSYLRDIEMNKKNPTVEILTFICFALDISIQEFFTESDSQINPYLLSAIELLNDEEQLKLSEFICTIKRKDTV